MGVDGMDMPVWRLPDLGQHSGYRTGDHHPAAGHGYDNASNIDGGNRRRLCGASTDHDLDRVKIGAGKRWARSSLLLGFILDALYTLSPPHHGILGYLTDVPDWGLQIYTLVMLYTAPGSGWFNRTKPTPAGA